MVAPDVIEENAENDPADPYVLALALQLWRENKAEEYYVVTEDKVDRVPLKISIRTACTRLGLNCMDTRNFAGSYRIWTRSPGLIRVSAEVAKRQRPIRGSGHTSDLPGECVGRPAGNPGFAASHGDGVDPLPGSRIPQPGPGRQIV